MTIKLPYNFGDTIYYMRDNRIRTAIIQSVCISNTYATKIYAVPQNENTCLEKKFSASDVYFSKQDLLDSL